MTDAPTQYADAVAKAFERQGREHAKGVMVVPVAWIVVQATPHDVEAFRAEWPDLSDSLVAVSMVKAGRAKIIGRMSIEGGGDPWPESLTR